jgi:hypothetical protein
LFSKSPVYKEECRSLKNLKKGLSDWVNLADVKHKVWHEAKPY